MTDVEAELGNYSGDIYLVNVEAKPQCAARLSKHGVTSENIREPQVFLL